MGYVPGIQRLVWPSGSDIPVTAYLWGGGGGGGGNDRGIGGAGSGGGFTEVNFLVSAGDVIDVAVGGSGSGGPSGSAGGVGGVAGSSYVSGLLFDTRSATAIDGPVIASTNTAYVGFLNTYGVWVSPTTAANFDRSYVVNFPVTGIYTFTASADNSAKLYVDDDFIGDVPGFTATYTMTTSVLAGNHTVRIVGVNTGGPGAVALTIDGGSSYSGGNGGRPGTAGSSGGGGGGGGATVVFKNNIPLAVAAGGGGGGGAGQSNGDSAPGSAGQAAAGVSAGQNGQDRTTDGGGGGAGGGGLGGGNGGLIVGGDSGANAGAVGLSSSPAQNPNGRNPGGQNNLYYSGAAGIGGRGGGGNGTTGAAVLLFQVPGVFVHTEISFKPVNQIWVKFNNVWQPVQSTRIKSDGVWTPTLDSFVPTFASTGTDFGIASRPIDPEPMPPDPPPPPFDPGSGWSAGDGWSFSPEPAVTSWSSSVNTMGDFGNSNLA